MIEDFHQSLGKPLDHFPIQDQVIKRWFALILSGLALFIGIGGTVNLLLNTYTAVQTHGPAMILGIFSFPMTAFVIIALLGIILLFIVLRHWRDSITLFETGMIRRRGNRKQTWFYRLTNQFDSHITQVKFGGSIINTQVKLVLISGSEDGWIIRNRYERMEDLNQKVRLCVLPGLIQRTRQALARGETVTFHQKIYASFNGLEINGQMTDYDDILVKHDNRNLRLHIKDHPNVSAFTAQLQHIKNLDLLYDLIENPPSQTVQLSPK